MYDVVRLYNQEALCMMVVYNKDCMLCCNRSSVCIRMLVVVHVVVVVIMKVHGSVGCLFQREYREIPLSRRFSG